MPISLPQTSTGMSLVPGTTEGDVLAGMRAGQGGRGVTQKGCPVLRVLSWDTIMRSVCAWVTYIQSKCDTVLPNQYLSGHITCYW